LMPPSFSVRAPAPAMPAIPETARAALPRAMSEPSIRARQHTVSTVFCLLSSRTNRGASDWIESSMSLHRLFLRSRSR
jgi:hypothetical protein